MLFQILGMMIPIDYMIFFRRVGIPPTRQGFPGKKPSIVMGYPHKTMEAKERSAHGAISGAAVGSMGSISMIFTPQKDRE